MNKNTKYWCAFSKLTKTASAFVNKLYNYFGRIDFAWNADISDLKQIEGVQYKSIESFIDERKTINPEECLEYILNKKIKYISLEDSEYPYLLKQTDNPPIGLFVAGSMEECNFERTLAVVGSRKASESSKKVLNKLISDFRGTDICIVSGMAEGIDTAAHKSALENNLKTIAVLGGGLDKI